MYIFGVFFSSLLFVQHYGTSITVMLLILKKKITTRVIIKFF